METERGDIVGRGGGSEGTGDDIGNQRQSTVPVSTTQNPGEQSTTEQPKPGVSTGVPEHGEVGGGNLKRDRKLPAIFTKSSEDMELQYFKGFKERSERILGELQRSHGQLVRDVFRFHNKKELENFIGILQADRHFRRGLLQVSREPTHVHVIHDCPWSNGHCRCNWWQKTKAYGYDARRDRSGHRRDSCKSRTLADIQNILFYYCSKGRQTVYQKIGGTMERLPSQGYNLQNTRLTGMSEIIGEVEVQIPGTGTELQNWEPTFSDDEPDQRDTYGPPRSKRRRVGNQERIQIRIVNLLRNNPICPPAAIIGTNLWRSDEELMFKDMSHKEVQCAVKCYMDCFNSWTMEQYQEMYSNEKCTPIFSAGHVDFESYYYNIENSIEVLEKLINYQCGGDEDATLEFIHTLFNVLERKKPKLNTICILSPTSAGKTFFFDAIKDYYINCGHLSMANKYNNFPFQDCAGRRIVLWNEPNYSPEFLDPIKELLGGDSTTVNVKYSQDTPVYRTPVIVTTNQPVSFMTNETFRDRLKVFRWRAAPWLVHYDKHPNPLAVYHLFKKYNLVQ